MDYDGLKKFIRIRTEHVLYQSVLIKTLLQNNGRATKSKIVQDLQGQNIRYGAGDLDDTFRALEDNTPPVIRLEASDCVLVDYALLSVGERAALVRFCNQRIENPDDFEELDVDEIIRQFKEWMSSKAGEKHRQDIANEKQEVKKMMDDLSAMDKSGPDFTDLVLYGLLPQYNTKYAKRTSTFAVFMNIKPFFGEYGYSDAEWNLVAKRIFTLAENCQREPEKLALHIGEFTADAIYSRQLQCGSITPILFCINDAFPVVNSAISRTYRDFADSQGWDDKISQKLEDYPDNITKCEKLIDFLHVDGMNFEVFDLFCWWYDKKRGEEPDAEEEDDTPDETSSKKPKEMDLNEFVDSLDLNKISDSEYYRLRSPDRIRIKDMLNRCQKSEWQLPNFQRYFDWKKTDIRDLLDSIFRDFYIGSLLLWETGGDPQLKLIPILGADSIDDDGRTQMIILDGQQRITSLYYAVKKISTSAQNIRKPVYFYIDFGRYLTGHETDCIKMRDQKLTRDESLKSLWFPFYELEDYELWTRELLEIIADSKNFKKANQIVNMIDKKLKHIIDGFEIPYVVLPTSIDLPQVADIFEKINTKGKSLSVFDILIATLSKYNIDLRQLWEDALKKHPRFQEYNKEDKMPIYILQSIALSYHDLSLCGKDDLLKIYHAVIGQKNLAFDEVWEEMADWVYGAIFKLENHNDGFGVRDRQSLPYLPVIPILASLLRAVDKRSDKSACHSKIRTWYWSSIFSEMYSSGVDSQLTRDYREMVGVTDDSGKHVPGWFDDNSRILTSVQDFRRSYPGTINLRDTKAGAVFKGVLSLIALEGAPDFDTEQHLSNTSNDKHHIFPKKPFTNHARVNSILNRTWLSEDTNRKIVSAKRPSAYIREFLNKNHGNDRKEFQKKILDGHLISKKAFEHMLNDDLDEFMDEREKTILAKIRDVVGIQGGNR